MQNIDRERIGLTTDELLTAFGGGAAEPVLATDNPLPNPTGTADPVDVVPPDPNKATIIPDKTDNSLLVFGGLALFGLIAFNPFGRKMSGSGTPNPAWLLPALAAGAGLIYLQSKKRTEALAAQREYLRGWINTLADKTAAAAGLAAIDTMAPDEIEDLYIIVHDYFNAGKTVTDPALQARYEYLVKTYLPMLT